MNEPLTDRERRILGELAVALRARIEDEARAAEALRGGRQETQEDRARARQTIEATYRLETDRAAAAFAVDTEAITSRVDQDRQAIERECDAAVAQLLREVTLAEQTAAQAFKESRWLAHSVYEAKKKQLSERAERSQRRLRERIHSVRAIEEAAAGWVVTMGSTPTPVTPVEGEPLAANGKILDEITDEITRAESQLAALRGLWLPRLTHGASPTAIFLAAVLLVVPVAFLFTGPAPLPWILASAVVAIPLGVTALLWLRVLGRRQMSVTYASLGATLSTAESLCKHALRHTASTARQRKRELRAQRNAEYERAAAEQAVVADECERRRTVELPRLTELADQRLVEIDRDAQELLRQARARRERQEADATAQRNQALEVADTTAQRLASALEATFVKNNAECTKTWNRTWTRAAGEVAAIEDALLSACPSWHALLQGEWRPPRNFPPAIPFGRLTGNLRQFVDELYAPRVAEFATDGAFSLPALLDFPERISMVVRAQGEGRQTATALLQSTMLRLLTSLPPGKVRLMIIDPVGLGENFASFMHLADYDELLVTHRIWTEPAQIERRLADLTEHMETVIQKYLRNEFATIEQYNEQAGEIAEPLRVLVVANFPAGFTDAAARRLASIAASGPRCGVHVLMSVDTRLPVVKSFNLADIESQSHVFTCQADQIRWHDPLFKDLSLSLDAAPLAEAQRLLQSVGEAAVAAKRVEVPFESVAPAANECWQTDSRRGLDIPLGRAGATRLQRLRLGEGTSQHVLIAGKTGSGKSTLLHALITNAALRYHPAELEFYLIDFKKGVEFKAYATHRLPHARVVAIESEREFGLSVMQRLDAEMRRRGELFRQSGVQDIAGYRDLGRALPRVMLVVDEFQEFFVQDDKLAQDAALLLDRLVRQGRAFGIHVVLGSQTLSGAYSLARSTLGQMAVRIALQCSEADAQVILSDDNAAARLLSRPGEAIYNDANGRVEGNHLFQVAWVPDDRREIHLAHIAERAAEVGHVPPPQIVFEGAQPADVEQCVPLASILAAEATGLAASPQTWLGEPLAIDEATAVAFRRRSGANLLWIGQNEEAVEGMIAATLVSLLAQLPTPEEFDSPPAVPCTIVPGGQVSAAFLSVLRRLVGDSPRRLRICSATDAVHVVAELAAEVARRQRSASEASPIFCLVHDLARCRALRRREDEFSFSRAADVEHARPDRQFAEVLREGPAVGVHVLVWCDTLTNLHRTFDRALLKEFDSRVLLQMSAADSSLLTDSPQASQLGRHRALLCREAEGRVEKFRPFRLPSLEWLANACARIGNRPAVLSEAARHD